MVKNRLGEHLEKLATFKMVGDLLSVHKASYRLGLSQPAVSRTIKVLEHILECRLMDRKANGIRLTFEGARLYEYAKIIERSLIDFDPHSSEQQQQQTRAFRLATYDNIACGVLSGMGDALSNEFLSLSISVVGPNSKILGDLVAGNFDCALMAQPRVMPGLTYQKVFTERYGLFASYKLSKRISQKNQKLLRLEDLRRFKIIAMADAIAGANRNVDRLLWEVGLQSLFNIDSYEVAAQLVMDGHGIGILPYSTAYRWVREQKIEELIVKEVSRSSFGIHEISLCWNAETLHPKLSQFRNLVTDTYSKIPQRVSSK